MQSAHVFFGANAVIGKVKWFNNVEGAGFIGQSDGPDGRARPRYTRAKVYRPRVVLA